MGDESRSLAEMGAALYGGEPPPAHVPPTEPVGRTGEQIASAMYDKPELPPEELPPEVKALREAEPARQIYSDTTQYKAAGIDKALADLGIEGQAAEAEHRTWAGVFADLDLNAQDAAHVVGLATMDEPSAETMQVWPDEAKTALQDEYGPDGWEQALADARRLVGRDPRLKDFLNRTGLGNHPDVVRIAARQARAAIASGKLKRT
ncbi:MAG: hypothetical protein K9J82_01135 [Methylotenera sp.]|jgi:hypothetical protein|nr:hypothetical protein [Methylotenera sp.]